jgi:CelD/BcsL family acetyltransferase involved in cellulose biosynthesis
VSSREEIAAALSDLAALHVARSLIPGKEIHRNSVRDSSEFSFLKAVLEISSEGGGACIYRLIVDERTIAALLVLQTKECSYFSLSGMSPEAWNYSPITLLQGQAIEDAAKLGQRLVNLSVGPNTSKMRWSEQLFVHPEFLLVSNRPLSANLFRGYWLATAVASLRREQRRHRVLTE